MATLIYGVPGTGAYLPIIRMARNSTNTTRASGTSAPGFVAPVAAFPLLPQATHIITYCHTNHDNPPTREDIARWLLAAMQTLPEQIVRNAWRHGNYSFQL